MASSSSLELLLPPLQPRLRLSEDDAEAPPSDTAAAEEVDGGAAAELPPRQRYAPSALLPSRLHVSLQLPLPLCRLPGLRLRWLLEGVYDSPLESLSLRPSLSVFER